MRKQTDGLIKPTGFFPWVIRASLIMLIIDATTGVERDVPTTPSKEPLIAKNKIKAAVNTWWFCLIG